MTERPLARHLYFQWRSAERRRACAGTTQAGQASREENAKKEAGQYSSVRAQLCAVAALGEFAQHAVSGFPLIDYQIETGCALVAPNGT